MFGPEGVPYNDITRHYWQLIDNALYREAKLCMVQSGLYVAAIAINTTIIVLCL
jgi:hypothetical protein